MPLAICAQDDDFDAMFGPTDMSENPFSKEMANDVIFSERSGSKPSFATEPESYWDDEQEGGAQAGREPQAGAESEDGLGGVLKGLLGGSGLETLGQNWDEDEEWDDEEDEDLVEDGQGVLREPQGLDEDDDDAFLSQFDLEEEVAVGREQGRQASLFGGGDESSRSESSEESILEKLRRRNPDSASALDLASPAEDSPEQGAGPKRDLDAIFGARPAQAPSPAAAAPLAKETVPAAKEKEEEEEEEQEDERPGFGPLEYNSKAAEEGRILETAADKLLAGLANDSEEVG